MSGISWQNGSSIINCSQTTFAGLSKFQDYMKFTKLMVLLIPSKTLLLVQCHHFVPLLWIAGIDLFPDVFGPLFEVTKDPGTHPELHVFLQRVVGFDTVDDESKIERRIHRKFPLPHLWNLPQSPPYSYWWISPRAQWPSINLIELRVYYMYANMASLNNWRRLRSFSASNNTPSWNHNDISATVYIRHFRLPTSLWRSRRYRSSNFSIPDLSLHLSRYTPPQSASTPISILSETNWHRDEPYLQQCTLLDLRTKPSSRLLQNWFECQLEYRWSVAIPLHEGTSIRGI